MPTLQILLRLELDQSSLSIFSRRNLDFHDIGNSSIRSKDLVQQIRGDLERRPNIILRVGHGDQKYAPVPCCRDYTCQFCMA